jgi:hypothetical protein
MKFKELQKKQAQLQHIKAKLKQEFFGIDKVIDQIVEKIQPWYLFNEAQTHPLVINLWGLTGTGKTSVVKELVKELGKEQALFRFEMNNRKNVDMESALNNAVNDYKDEDYIFCFDEFQSVRTLDGYGNDVDNELRFNLWDFLDTGEIEKNTAYFVNRRTHYLSWYKTLYAWHELGFKIRDGFICFDEQPEKFRNYLLEYYRIDGKEPKEYMKRPERSDLFKLFKDRFETILDFESFYRKASVEDLLDLLYEGAKRQRTSEKAYLKHALIFVMGNLDEAYMMSNDFNPDISADRFCESSLKINLQHIKKALQKRFRNEQIARLGNNHVIYPALNKLSFQKIISHHLNELKQRFLKNYSFQLEFDTSVETMVYNNGVYPTQGVRPVKSSLKSNIDANLGQILSHLAISSLDPDLIKLSYTEPILSVDYYVEGDIVEHLEIPIEATLDNIRQVKDKNKQIVIAIHEAGHALLSICLLKNIPDLITSSTVDTESDGFMTLNLNDSLISKRDILNYLAMYLAGIEAEKFIFGNDLATIGASSDLKKATQLALKSISQYGLGSKVGYFQLNDIHSKNNLSHALPEIEEEAQALLNNAQQLAHRIMSKEKTLLLKIASQLMQNVKLDASQLKPIIKKYAKVTTLDFIENAKEEKPHLDLFYQHLKQIPTQKLKFEERFIENMGLLIEQNNLTRT